MNSPQNDDAFDRITAGFHQAPTHAEYIDPHPYGPPTSANARPGLTPRGKVALGVGAAVLASGALMGYQAWQANTLKAQEVALKAETLELERLRETNRALESTAARQNEQVTARQEDINGCVKEHADQVGKGFGSPSARDVIDLCQAQYADAPTTGSGMENAASESSTDSSGGGVSDGALIGGLVVAGGLYIAVRRGKRNEPAA